MCYILDVFCFRCCIFYYYCCACAVGTDIGTMVKDKTKRAWPEDSKGNIIGNKNGEFAVTWVDYRYQVYQKGIRT